MMHKNKVCFMRLICCYNMCVFPKNKNQMTTISCPDVIPTVAHWSKLKENGGDYCIEFKVNCI